MPVLLIATSPRGTGITAPDQPTAEHVRQILAGAFSDVQKRAHTVDVGIGIEAFDAGKPSVDGWILIRLAL
ncbi:hypothetical protein [Nocardioides sp. Root140]|uniref:hypothetical protein n=1 Tax=Nocardioides sp. Root140 TaxID=1736460 RepID=UPI000714DDA7|nr:hypothetical protein [Nocardioides sp. Root140]KQY61842.1 hypothetical protein ASD30_25200 [Nocardioides sp. Root140]